MEKDRFDKAKFLYDIAVANETSIENPGDVSLSIQNMLAEIRALGYEEFSCLSDVELRNINNPRIMRILLKYYEQMDLFTRDSLMYKMHPKHCPEVISIATAEFLNLGPSDRRLLNGFQTAMSKGTITDAYLNEMFKLLENGEEYVALSEVRKRLCQNTPERMLPIIDKYSKNVLLLCVIQDCVYLADSDEIVGKLESWGNISEEEIQSIQLRENNQDLSVTTYEYYRDLCTVERVRTDAKKALKKIKQRKEKEKCYK